MSDQEKVHQRLMNEAYDRWNSPPLQGKSYQDFLMKLTPIHRDAVVLGNLNYQVENGGFSQWLGNGYGETMGFLRSAVDKMMTQTAKEVYSLARKAIQFDPDSVCGEDTDDLDKAFYKINAQFLQDCEAYFRKAVAEQIHAA